MFIVGIQNLKLKFRTKTNLNKKSMATILIINFMFIQVPMKCYALFLYNIFLGHPPK